MAFRVARADELEWIEREPVADGTARYVARLSEVLGFEHSRGNIWRYPAGSKGRRHSDNVQEETFVVVDGTLTMYLGDPPERVEVPKAGVVPGGAGPVLQLANHGDDEVLLYAYGAPPEAGGAEFFDSVA